GRRLVPLCVAWWWLLHAPTILHPLNVIANDHRVYLPLIAAALVAGAALARVTELLAARWDSFLLGVVPAAVCIATFVPLVFQRSLEWKDDETLWRIAVERAPGSARAHMHLGAVIFEKGMAEMGDGPRRLALIDEALNEYEASRGLHDGWLDLWLNLGNGWFE